MPVEEEVVKIRSKLEKMLSSEAADQTSAADILKTLQDLPMNLEVLQKTRIGVTVNNFRKVSKDEDVISLSRNLIKSWKKMVPDTAKSDKKEKGGSKNGDGGESSEEGEKKADMSRRESTSAPDTSDPVRIKCRELICNALKTNGLPEDCHSGDGDANGRLDPFELAASIEENVYEEFKSTSTKYKNRIRSRVANLKDTKNPELRLNVLSGLIPPDRMAKMSAEEMASSEMQTLRARYTKESIDDHQMAKTGGTATDLFKCGKCGKYNCTYNQVQTRSADEPMTTFVFCNECGNRWKFC